MDTLQPTPQGLASRVAVEVKHIRIDGGTQSRAAISEDTVTEYADLIAAGVQFPAVVVFFDGVTYWLGDGFHRFFARLRLRATSMMCDVYQGTRRDAVYYGVGANTAHGLRRSNADKRRAVTTLLGDDQWQRMSDREIARHCGVSQGMVSYTRGDLETSNQISHTDERIRSDGRVQNFEARRAAAPPQPSASPPTLSAPKAYQKAVPPKPTKAPQSTLQSGCVNRDAEEPTAPPDTLSEHLGSGPTDF